MQPVKYIAVNQSGLYRIGTRRDLASLLGVELSVLKKLSTDENYREWTKKTLGKKDRIIEEPLPELAAVLGRLQVLLSRVETPSWLMSGKKRIKPQDNAVLHLVNQHMITVDIQEFYVSTKREYVYLAFKNLFGQSDDVASLLASLVTYKGHIPTGAATSQLIAFWAYRLTFERIYKLAALSGIAMSVWVDDITFSSLKPLPKNWAQDVKNIWQEVALSLKSTKTKYYSSKDYKSVTGSAITPDGRLTVRNAKRKEIVELMHGKNIEKLTLGEARSLFGKLSAQRQNEAGFYNVVFTRLKNHLRNMERNRRKKAAT